MTTVKKEVPLGSLQMRGRRLNLRVKATLRNRQLTVPTTSQHQRQTQKTPDQKAPAQAPDRLKNRA